MEKSASPTGAAAVLAPPVARYDEQGPLTAEQISAYIVGAAIWAPSIHKAAECGRSERARDDDQLWRCVVYG